MVTPNTPPQTPYPRTPNGDPPRPDIAPAVEPPATQPIHAPIPGEPIHGPIPGEPIHGPTPDPTPPEPSGPVAPRRLTPTA